MARTCCFNLSRITKSKTLLRCVMTAVVLYLEHSTGSPLVLLPWLRFNRILRSIARANVLPFPLNCKLTHLLIGLNLWSAVKDLSYTLSAQTCEPTVAVRCSCIGLINAYARCAVAYCLNYGCQQAVYLDLKAVMPYGWEGHRGAYGRVYYVKYQP